jgi:hypothetical protein
VTGRDERGIIASAAAHRRGDSGALMCSGLLAGLLHSGRGRTVQSTGRVGEVGVCNCDRTLVEALPVPSAAGIVRLVCVRSSQNQEVSPTWLYDITRNVLTCVSVAVQSFQ